MEIEGRAAVDAAEGVYSVTGDDLRIMWDEGAGPLWSTGDGLLPDDPAWLSRALGLSDDLIAELLRWLRDKDTAHRFGQSPAQLDERAEQLAGRLQSEVGPRFKVRYHP